MSLQINTCGLALCTVACLVSPAFAVVNIVYVTVGHSGNAADPSTGLGAVATPFKIGKYEVTNAQYAEFLNAKGASNANGIFGYPAISRGIIQYGVSGSFSYSVRSGFENRPVNYVSWYNAARFINWLGNGQGDGDMETGAYTLTGNTGIISVNPGASIYNPTEDEWYKAAYYNGQSANYSLYPHGLNSITTADANFDSSGSKAVGSYSGDPGFYGTLDQGGNVWEWNDAVIGSARGMRGGSYSGSERSLRSSDSFTYDPAVGFENVGFRVASVPETASTLLMMLGSTVMLIRRKRLGSSSPLCPWNCQIGVASRGDNSKSPRPDDMEPIFEIVNAKVWRGETLALRDFSLTLVHGESVAILGPNGAGKSSFLKLLTGEVRPEADPATTCRLFGEELWSLEEIRHRIGVVMPEEVSRFEPYEITRDAVLSSLRGAYGRTRDMRFSLLEKDRARIAMEQMGVAHLADREFGTLSSGERRRILIARALVHQPQVLVLDEPSTALDFAAAIQLTGMLRAWLAADRDLILVTHHPGEIPPEIERVILLRDGRVFADGPKRDIITAARLSTLYQVDLTVTWSNGWCDLRPA